MKTWKATFKVKGNDHLLTPKYIFPDGEPKTREDMIKFWWLDNSDIEWYKLELLNE